MISEKHAWSILEDIFKRDGFVHHQTTTFSHFLCYGLQRIITEEPDIIITPKNDKEKKYSKYSVSFSDVYIPKPSVMEDRELRDFYPSEARQRDLTYDAPIFVTITETTEVDGQEPEINKYFRVILGRIPIMLRSSHCHLSNMTPEERIKAGECPYDEGGYFIVKGKERVLISQIRGIYNIPLVIEQKPGDKIKYSCELRSMSEETGHSVLIQAVIGTDDSTLAFSIPHIKEIIPIGIVFKALGYNSNDIRDLIGITYSKADKYIRIILNDSYIVNDVNPEITRINALKYIGMRASNPVKETDQCTYAEQILDNEIFPHMGVTSTKREKAYILGHMVHKLLSTHLGLRNLDDRDNYINKRVESPGVLCYELFRQLFKKYVNTILAHIEKKKQFPDVMSIIPRLTDITKGFQHCFGTGNWGVPKNSYVRPGVAQILSRLSYGATVSNLRRLSIPVGKESKNAVIRQINPSQIMFICPVECFDPNTKILMWDRSVKRAGNIIVGDALIDDLGNKTVVKSTCSGYKNMYDVIPNKLNFDTHRVTDNHILTLRIKQHKVIQKINTTHIVTFFNRKIMKYQEKYFYNLQNAEKFITTITDDDTIDITISDYLQLDEDTKNNLVLFKNPYINLPKNTHTHTQFQLKQAGIGPFVGWQLQDPKGRFTLACGTITHNTPEGAPCGTVLNLSLLTRISERTPTVLVKEVIEQCDNITLIGDFEGPNQDTKVFLNGIIIGMSEEPHELVKELKQLREINMIPWDVSVSYNDDEDEIHIFSDEGRLLRPVFTVKDDKLLGTEKDGTNWYELLKKGIITYIDNCEANGAVIAFSQKELTKYHNDYCEIAPAMMMGVMGNIIPFPDHSQCIFKDEPVYMANGSVKKICDVKVGDKVITFHPETLQQSITEVSHTYTNQTEKQLYELTTISNRKIIATYDHRFMTSEGWCRIEHMEEGKTLIGISTEPQPVSLLVDEYTILTKDIFIEKCTIAGIKESFIQKYINDLSNFFPLKSNDSRIIILARMSGFVSTDCWIGVSDSGVIRLACHFGHEHSSKLFAEDVEILGFRYTEKEKYGNTFCLEYSGAFPSLLIALGSLYGKKSIQKYNRLPTWIKNGSDMVKREFLAGFQGGDGSKIKSGSEKQIQIHMSSTMKSIVKKYEKSLFEYMADIVNLFLHLGIQVSNPVSTNNKKYPDIVNVSYYICCSRTNLIKYFNIIGYRYDVHKNIESGILVEYLKYLETKYQERLELVENITKYGNLSRIEIAKNLNIPVKQVYNILKLEGKNIGLPKGLLSVKEWISSIKWASTTMFIPLKTKVKSKETIISDITTVSTNQSFLCGDTFCVHNSPRNCYQCLDPDTPVVMANGQQKLIKNICIGDEVITVDPNNCAQSTTKIINQYVKETDKKVIKIITESGRMITCTEDHQILTSSGWQEAKYANDICVIPQQVIYLSGGDSDLNIILPKTRVQIKHRKDLENKGLFPVKASKLPIFARIVGYLLSDGSCGVYSKGPQVQFTFGSPEGCQEFIQDITSLGFNANKIVDTYSPEYGKCQQIVYNNSLASLLIALVDGKRSTQPHPPLPNWIKNGSQLVKREFLSGFQGGDGCKFRYNKLNKRKCGNFILNSTSQTTRKEHLLQLLDFMSEIRDLFGEFEIETTGPVVRKSKCDSSNTVHIYFRNTKENHIKYFERIGWRYDEYKLVESIPIYEYHKVCIEQTNRIAIERTTISHMLENNYTVSDIAKKLEKNDSYIRDSIRCIKQNRKPRLPNNFSNFTEWVRVMKKRAIFVKISSKIATEQNIIADITTESSNQSFIAGDSLCVHNSAMGKQAMSMFALSHLIRADTVVHVLNTPQRPIVSTRGAQMMGFNDMPSGINAIVAIACYSGLILY